MRPFEHIDNDRARIGEVISLHQDAAFVRPFLQYGLEKLSNQRQHSCCAWTEGHFTDPYEQNTQQSPAFGFSIALQPSH